MLVSLIATVKSDENKSVGLEIGLFGIQREWWDMRKETQAPCYVTCWRAYLSGYRFGHEAVDGNAEGSHDGF